MALKNSVTGEVRRTYTIADLEDAAKLMRGYDLVRSECRRLRARRRHALDHGHRRRPLPESRKP